MSKLRSRKQASARLGIELQKRYERLAFAKEQDEITVAAVDLGELFNDNIEFVIYVLKSFGGINAPAPEMTNRKPKKAELPKLPEFMAQPGVTKPIHDCTCPPLEAGIIGRERHMTSCPQFEPVS